MKGLSYKSIPARVFPDHLRDAKAGMRDITTPATTDFHLAQEFAGLFHQDHFQGRVQPGCIHRAKDPGGAATDNNQRFLWIIQENCL